jgi:hypothetical protein
MKIAELLLAGERSLPMVHNVVGTRGFSNPDMPLLRRDVPSHGPFLLANVVNPTSGPGSFAM